MGEVLHYGVCVSYVDDDERSLPPRLMTDPGYTFKAVKEPMYIHQFKQWVIETTAGFKSYINNDKIKSISWQPVLE